MGLAPDLRRDLEGRSSQRVQLAFGIAIKRLRTRAACRAMFEELGADGIGKLAATMYYGVSRGERRKVCARGAEAMTEVASPVTWICPSFGGLSNEGAALTLIHEALHFAGLVERPAQPAGMSSREINDRVKGRCL